MPQGNPEAYNMPQQEPVAEGPQPVQEVGFNQMVQNVLWSRIQSMSMEEVELLDDIVTPQTFPVLVKLLPEMQLIFEQASMFAQEQQGPIRSQSAQQENPLVNPNVSRGLVG